MASGCGTCGDERTIECPNCGGDGYSHVHILPETCYQCGGDGQIDCPDCVDSDSSQDEDEDE